MTELVSFLPLVAIALLFWLMVVRPASRRQKNLARIQSELQPGQRVMLSSGIFGTVTSIADDRRAVIGTSNTTFDPYAVTEGAPVIDRSGRLIGLCTHVGDDVVLIDSASISDVLSGLFAGL